MVRAIETCIWEGWRDLSRSSRFEVIDEPTMLRFASRINFPPFNGVMRTRLVANNVDAAIDSVIDYFGSLGVPFTWTVEPSNTPADLDERLVARGFVLEGDGEPGMASDLETLPESVNAPQGLRIEKVSGDELLGDYTGVLTAGFGLPLEASRQFAEIFAEATAPPDSQMWAYLGRLDGKAVATSGLMLAGGIAGIVNVATLPEARGKGIGAAVTHAGLAEAHKLGYRIAILQSSAMGYNVYKRLGFVEYCRLRQYVWTR